MSTMQDYQSRLSGTRTRKVGTLYYQPPLSAPGVRKHVE